MSRQKYDHLFKLLIVGDGNEGKTSLLLRFRMIHILNLQQWV